MKISVICPSFLGEYDGSAKNLPQKFERAVDSFLRQVYKNAELIVISDGCEQTNKILKSKYKKHLDSGFIKLLELERHPLFTGAIRQAGIDIATGDVLCNLDVDDEFTPNHLWNISVAFDYKRYSWAYFNLYRKLDNLKGVEEVLNATPDLDSLCTANVIWRRDLNVTWIGADGRSDNKIFNKQLLEKYKDKIKLYGNGYIIHHANISHVNN